MSIRKLQKTDYNKRYLELLNQLKPIIRYDQEIFNNIFEDISNDIRHNIFVIEDDGIIVGTITVLLESKFIFMGDKLGHIEDLVVDRSYRNKGYGGMLVNYCIDYCRENGCKKIGLCSRVNAQEFYYKKGFDVIGNYFAKYLKI